MTNWNGPENNMRHRTYANPMPLGPSGCILGEHHWVVMLCMAKEESKQYAAGVEAMPLHLSAATPNKDAPEAAHMTLKHCPEKGQWCKNGLRRAGTFASTYSHESRGVFNKLTARSGNRIPV